MNYKHFRETPRRRLRRPDCRPARVLRFAPEGKQRTHACGPRRLLCQPPPVLKHHLLRQAKEGAGQSVEGGLSDVDREVLKMQKEPLDKGTPDTKGPKWRVKEWGAW